MPQIKYQCKHIVISVFLANYTTALRKISGEMSLADMICKLFLYLSFDLFVKVNRTGQLKKYVGLMKSLKTIKSHIMFYLKRKQKGLDPTLYTAFCFTVGQILKFNYSAQRICTNLRWEHRKAIYLFMFMFISLQYIIQNDKVFTCVRLPLICKRTNQLIMYILWMFICEFYARQTVLTADIELRKINKNYKN